MQFEVLNPTVWSGRRVLLTGHTGFKGSWMALLLQRLGAHVTGVSLAPAEPHRLFDILSPWSDLVSIDCDIRNQHALHEVVARCQPEIVIHMAAQALVMDAYSDPVGTISSNVMGTVHLLEALRFVENLACVLVVTSDKVYENREAGAAFAEEAALGGHDPYSASKAAAEILTSAYQRSFFKEFGVPVATARAGNVIGGGDWAPNRLIPDLWRAYESKHPVLIRSPDSVRPWQHVLDPIYGYLLYVQRFLSSANNAPSSLNFGPPQEPVRTVLQVAQQFSLVMQSDDLWSVGDAPRGMHESRFLSIDSSLAYKTLGWKTALSVDDAIRWSGDWYRAYKAGHEMRSFTNDQITTYFDLVRSAAGRLPLTV